METMKYTGMAAHLCHAMRIDYFLENTQVVRLQSQFQKKPIPNQMVVSSAVMNVGRNEQ